MVEQCTTAVSQAVAASLPAANDRSAMLGMLMAGMDPAYDRPRATPPPNLGPGTENTYAD